MNIAILKLFSIFRPREIFHFASNDITDSGPSIDGKNRVDIIIYIYPKHTYDIYDHHRRQQGHRQGNSL